MSSKIFKAVLYRKLINGNLKKYFGEIIITTPFENPEKLFAIFSDGQNNNYVVNPNPGLKYRNCIWLFKENDKYINKIFEGVRK